MNKYQTAWMLTFLIWALIVGLFVFGLYYPREFIVLLLVFFVVYSIIGSYYLILTWLDYRDSTKL